jgi:hypothetical protein
MPQVNSPPRPINYISPRDANGAIIQYMQSDRALLYQVATQAPVTFGAGVSSTVTTLGLYNPITSKTNLMIRSCQMALSGEPAAAAVLFYAKIVGSANPTGVTPLTALPVVTQFGINFSYTPVGVPFSAGTLFGAPNIIRIASDVLSTSALQIAFDDYINGQIILEPGGQLAIQANAACTGYISLLWEETCPPEGATGASMVW